MKGILRYGLTLVLICAAWYSHAQERETRRVYFRVIGGYRVKDTSYIIINGGSGLGVMNGANAFAYSVYSAKDGKMVRDNVNLGYGRVVEVYKDSAICIINQVKTGSLKDSVWIGDMVETETSMPLRRHRSLYFDLAVQNIFFLDVDGNYIYDLPFLYRIDTPIVDKVVADLVKRSFRKVHEKYKDNDLGPALLQPLKDEGRFKGRVPFTMMLDATTEEINDFIAFVRDYPGKYMGADHSMAETFLTWVINGGNYPPTEVMKSLRSSSLDPQAFQKELDRFEKSIRDENMIYVFADSITRASNEGDRKEWSLYRDISLSAARRFRDTSGMLAVMNALAKSSLNDHEYLQAVKYSDTIIQTARLKEMYTAEFDAYLLRTDALVKLGLKDMAKSTLKELEQRLALYKRKMPADLHHSMMQMRYQYDGWVNYTFKDYGRAVKMYLIAADMNNNSSKTFSSRSNNALIYKTLGQIYKDQGKNMEALIQFKAAAALYDSINYVQDKAWVWNEIGAALYNLGKYADALDWFGNALRINRVFTNDDNVGYSYSMMANCYSSLGKVDTAIYLHQNAITYRRTVNPRGTAYSWDQLGELYKSNAYKTEALQAYDSSRSIYLLLKDSSSISDNYLNVGLVHQAEENYRKAIRYYDSAVNVSPYPSSAAQFDLGLAWGQLEKKKGVRYYERAEKLTDSLKDYALQFKTLNFLASDYYQLNQTAKGDAAFFRMERLMKDIGTPSRQASLYEVRASKYLKNAKLDSSYLMYDAARKIYDTVSKLDAVYSMLNLSEVLTQQGKFEKSLGWLQKALSYSREMNSPMGKAITFNSLAFLYGEMGELNQAMFAIDSALYLFQRNSNFLRESGARIQKGMLYKDKGDYKTGLENILYADSVYLAEGALDSRRVTLNNAGVVYYNQADYNKAIAYFKEAEQFFTRDEIDEYVLVNRANIAECYYYQKKYKEASAIMDEYYGRAAKLGFVRIATGMANLQGKIAFEQGDLEKALKYATEANNYSKASGAADQMIDAMVMQGKVYAAKGQAPKAIEYLRTAIDKGAILGLKSGEWVALYEMGIVFYQQKKYDSATHYFGAAVDIVEKNAGNVFGGEEAKKLFSTDARKVDLYNKIIASYVARKDSKKASEYALRNAITAINSKYGQDLSFADSTLKADLARAEEYQRKINAVDQSIAQADTKEKKEALLKTKRILEEGYQNFIDERKEKYNDFEKFLRGNVNPEDLSNYKGGLPEDMAVVSYVINDSQLYKFIVTNSTVEIATTVLDRDINEMINEYIASLITPDSASGTGALKVRAEFATQSVAAKPFRQTSEALYHVLMDDVLPVIGKKKKLCIIPSGKLSNIPYQCLGKMDQGKFRFLMEDYRVFYTNRMDMFRSKEQPDKDLSNMAAFGNPDKSLEFARKEVLDIQRIVKNRQVLVEEQATEQEARMALGQRKYIHFATHGTLDYVKPKQSYLTFSASPGGVDDGRLTIAEIDSLKAPGQYAELVTLSACETARPLAISEDWYVSPANSFLRKKFKTVVASLWQVNDEATGILMTEFYKNLEKMDKVDALRQAQQTLSNHPKYVHPYYWGGFVLYGDWR